MERVKSLTTLSLSEREMRERFEADKISLEAKLKETFALRRTANVNGQTFTFLDDLVKSISAELRAVKAKLRDVTV